MVSKHGLFFDNNIVLYISNKKRKSKQKKKN